MSTFCGVLSCSHSERKLLRDQVGRDYNYPSTQPFGYKFSIIVGHIDESNGVPDESDAPLITRYWFR